MLLAWLHALLLSWPLGLLPAWSLGWLSKGSLAVLATQPKTWPCLTSFEPAVTFVSSRGGKGFKHISLRSLSCESGQQWITADNLLNGDILAYTFRVPDPTARGLSRLISLSIIATGMSKSAFLNSSASKLVFPKGPSNIVNDM